MSAIGFWADSDPLAAATWINQNNPGEASDPGAARIALSPQLAQNPKWPPAGPKALPIPSCAWKPWLPS